LHSLGENFQCKWSHKMVLGQLQLQPPQSLQNIITIQAPNDWQGAT